MKIKDMAELLNTSEYKLRKILLKHGMNLLINEAERLNAIDNFKSGKGLATHDKIELRFLEEAYKNLNDAMQNHANNA